MRTRLNALALAAAASIATACTGSPSPLAPTIHGSIGVPHDGMISDAVPLPQRGVGYTRLRNDRRNYGNARLVNAIASAARSVAEERPGGARLVIGDISARWGGQASGHHSHRTGRDADLLYYVVTLDGTPIQSPGFLRFGPDGLAEVTKGKYARIDLEREWLLIKALISSREANVQWLFCAHWLEAMIIEYALARGEDPALVWHAESVLQQPNDSGTHDDHLHLRVACTPDESIAGCLGGGPYWPWLPQLPTLAALPDSELR